MILALIVTWAFTWLTRAPGPGPLKEHTSPWYESKGACESARAAFEKQTGVLTTYECQPVQIRRDEWRI